MSRNSIDPHENRIGTAAVGNEDADRRQYSRDLREGEQSLRLQVGGLRNVAIFTLDRSGRVATWNAGAERFKGYKAAEIIGKDFSCFYSAEDIAASKPKRELAIAEQEGCFEGDGLRIRKDGGSFLANVIITSLYDPNGQLIGFSNFVQNVTERRKLSEQFRLAIEAAPTGMLMMDRAGRIVLVNTQVEKLFGYRRDELLGQGIEKLVPKRFRERHPEFRESFFGDPTARAMGSGRDLYGLRKDGSEVPIEIGLNPLQTSEGDFVLSSVADITERKRAVEQFRLAIEAAPTGMLMMDRAGRIVLVNTQVEKLFGYRRDELLGQGIEKLVPKRFRERHPEFRESFFGDPTARAMGSGRDLYGLHKDGSEVPIEIGLNPLQTSEGDFVLSSVVDITERKRAEMDLSRQSNDLQAINRQLHAANAELQSFAYSVSHDLRAPLRHVQGYIELLTRECLTTQLSDKARDHLLTISEASTEMAQLIDGLLTFSRMGQIELQESQVKLEGVVQDAIKGLEKETQGRNIDWKITPLPHVFGDPTALKQVFANLIGNAVKYSGPRNPAHIEIGCAGDEDGRAILFVRDNGVGFDMQYAHKLFRVFQRLHRDAQFEGTGIGLAIVQRLVVRHGGRVWAEGALNEGATIYFTLPRATVG